MSGQFETVNVPRRLKLASLAETPSQNLLFFTEAGHVLKMFLFFEKFEPQRSYKHGSYKKKACKGFKLLIEVCQKSRHDRHDRHDCGIDTSKLIC